MRSYLRKDELFDQRSYHHKILAQRYGAKADQFRHGAYSIRSVVNGLFARALTLKERAYRMESGATDPKSPVWRKIYGLKKNAFALETKANKLNSKFYRLKKMFYTYAEQEALEHAKFTMLKSKNYGLKIKTRAPGECGLKSPATGGKK